MVQSQPNAKIHLIATAAVLAAGLLLPLSRLEWCAVVIAVTMVFAAEAMNTALEFLADAAVPKVHPLIQKSKDAGAAAVLLSAIGAAIIGMLVFGPHLVRMFTEQQSF